MNVIYDLFTTIFGISMQSDALSQTSKMQYFVQIANILPGICVSTATHQEFSTLLRFVFLLMKTQ